MWGDATVNRLVAHLRAVIDALVCPYCTTANRPGVRLITVVDGRAECSVCAKTWMLTEGEGT